MSDDLCKSCGQTGYGHVNACAFCGKSGCEACMFDDADVMYGDSKCCDEARAMSVAWWSMSSEQRAQFPRGVCADDMTGDEARAVLAKMRTA